LIGMVHLPALPGSPEFDGDRSAVRERALADAQTLAAAGFDACLMENLGDTPYYPETVPRHVIAEMAALTRELRLAVDLPVGVNILRNDAAGALGVAAAGGGSFVRANIHIGARETDQGRVDGQAHETLRLRDRLNANVALFADIAVKHSAPVSDRPRAAVVEETVDRGRADGLIVTGAATGKAPTVEQVQGVVDARDNTDRTPPVLIGSGLNMENISELLSVADGAIVGTAIKDGDTATPVDPEQAARLVALREQL
jgi:membrane complex biogenesis protein, BtpA family